MQMTNQMFQKFVKKQIQQKHNDNIIILISIYFEI